MPCKNLSTPLAILFLLLPLACRAEAVEEQEADARAQITYNWQKHPGFSAAYTGQNSIAPSAENAATRDNKVVGVFSLEMSKEALLMRMLASYARVDSHKLRTGFIAREDMQKLTFAMEKLMQARLFIDDTPGISVTEMRSKARRLKQQERRLDLIIVDYLQLMSAVAIGGKRFENRTQEVSAISRGLKAVAKELKVPVVSLSQLSRAPESRGGDHRPQLADLRESGSIEQDADVVAFIFREEVYKKNDPDLEGLAELIIAKQRNGPTGTIKLAFKHASTRFENLASEEYIQ